MPWLRLGDTAATYPRLLQIAGYPGASASAVNEVFGFLVRCSAQSAAHVTDYVVDFGTAQMFGGTRTKKLIDWCTRATLLTPVLVDDVQVWVILNDPKFIHIRTQAELDAEDRKRDVAKKPHLAVDVRHRDGDNCRYCGIYVMWDGRKSPRSGELDHLDPNEYANTADDLVVACRSCNGGRQEGGTGWDLSHPLWPAPTNPQYGEPTAAWLTANGRPTEPNVDHDVLRARGKVSSSKPAAAPQAARPAAPTQPTPPTQDAAPADEPRPELPPNPDIEPVPRSIGTGSAGSGRDGSGPGTGPVTGTGPKRRRRRGSRGGRGKPATARAATQPERPTMDPCCSNPYVVKDSGTHLCLTCGTEQRASA